MIELLRAAAHDNGSTVLIVAHDSRVIPYADRVFHLDDGVLVEGIEKPLATYGTGHIPSHGIGNGNGNGNGIHKSSALPHPRG